MPFFSIVHLRELRCPDCGALLAPAGGRSFIVDRAGLPAFFDPDDPPAEMSVEIRCCNAHATPLLIPNEVSAEEVLSTPDAAPIGSDAVLCSAAAESGKAL